MSPQESTPPPRVRGDAELGHLFAAAAILVAVEVSRGEIPPGVAWYAETLAEAHKATARAAAAGGRPEAVAVRMVRSPRCACGRPVIIQPRQNSGRGRVYGYCCTVCRGTRHDQHTDTCDRRAGVPA